MRLSEALAQQGAEGLYLYDVSLPLKLPGCLRSLFRKPLSKASLEGRFKGLTHIFDDVQGLFQAISNGFEAILIENCHVP